MPSLITNQCFVPIFTVSQIYTGVFRNLSKGLKFPNDKCNVVQYGKTRILLSDKRSTRAWTNLTFPFNIRGTIRFFFLLEFLSLETTTITITTTTTVTAFCCLFNFYHKKEEKQKTETWRITTRSLTTTKRYSS